MLLPLLGLLACRSDDDSPDPPGPTAPPTAPALVALEVTQPTLVAPLTRRLRVETTEPTTLTARWTDGNHEVAVAWPGEATVHEHTLLGFHPDATYTITVAATAAGGAIESTATTVTDPLPVEFPSAVLAAPGIPAPGHTLVPLNSSNPAIPVNAAVLAYDEAGIPCFYLEVPDQLEDAVPYAGGLLVTSGLEQRVARFVAWDGTEGTAFTLDASAVAPYVPVRAAVAERFHHDVFPHPAIPGRFFALGRTPFDQQDWRASYVDPSVREDRLVADDVLVEFDETGAVYGEIALSELLPTDRIGYDSLENVYPGWGDWTHANSLWWDDGAYIVSLRHQDAVVKIDAATGELKWILGTSDNWVPPWSDALLEPEGELEWQWHQHAAELGPDAPDGRRQLVLFDNGNWKASPFTGDPPASAPRTRVVQFGIDEANGTVRMDWSYEVSTVTGAEMYSEAVGDADFLPNGHILSTWGMLASQPDGTPNVDVGLGTRSVRLIEFDPETLEDVWHLSLTVPLALNPDGWTAYRSERIPSLYGRIVD